jgi:hypothetical protein
VDQVERHITIQAVVVHGTGLSMLVVVISKSYSPKNVQKELIG